MRRLLIVAGVLLTACGLALIGVGVQRASEPQERLDVFQPFFDRHESDPEAFPIDSEFAAAFDEAQDEVGRAHLLRNGGIGLAAAGLAATGVGIFRRRGSHEAA